MMARKRIVASFSTQKQEYHAFQSADARKTAARCGFEIEILDAEDNGVLQIQQLFRCIHVPAEERPFAFVVQTQVPDALERLARNALGQGIGWVLLNRPMPYVDALRREHPRAALASVTTDHAEIGRIQARQFRALLPRGGSVLYIQGPPSTAAAQARLAAARAEIQGSGIELRVVFGEWTESSGEAAVKAWLRLKTSDQLRPHIVGSQNDAMALGAQKAMRAHRPDWTDVLYTGCDGLPESGLRLVEIGQLAATIVVPSCGGPAVEVMDRTFRTGNPPPPSVVVLPQSFPPTEVLRAARADTKGRPLEAGAARRASPGGSAR